MTNTNKPPHTEAARALAEKVNEFFRELPEENRWEAAVAFDAAVRIAGPWFMEVYVPHGGEPVSSSVRRNMCGARIAEEVCQEEPAGPSKSLSPDERQRLLAHDERLRAEGWVLIDVPKEETEQ